MLKAKKEQLLVQQRQIERELAYLESDNNNDYSDEHLQQQIAQAQKDIVFIEQTFKPL